VAGTVWTADFGRGYGAECTAMQYSAYRSDQNAFGKRTFCLRRMWPSHTNKCMSCQSGPVEFNYICFVTVYWLYIQGVTRHFLPLTVLE
jgi:hypothetical protein